MHRLATFTLVVLSCSPKPADTLGEGDSSGGEPASSGGEATSAGTPTTSAGETGESGSEGGASDTGPGETVTTATVTTANPTDEPPESLPEVCAEWCARFADCDIDDGVGCVEFCIGDTQLGSECAMLLATKVSCAVPLECEEFIDVLNESTSTCLDEALAWEAACKDGPCLLKGGEFAGDACSIGRECPGIRQEYVCADGVCTCFENMVPGKACPNMGACDPDSIALEEQAKACCGWFP